MASTTATGPDISGTRTASSSISRSLSSALSSVSGTISRNITSSSSTISSSKSPVSTSPVATSVNDLVNADDGKAQGLEGISLETFLASLSVAAIVFAVEVLLFILLRKKLKRVYEPRTYLVPEKRRTPAPLSGFFNFFAPVFATANSDFISKSGLDAYFFLRYLLMLLKVFVIVALFILPVLLPINYLGGKGGEEVQGLDMFAWTNVSPASTNRYWAHLVLALGLIVVFCYVFYDEMRKYIRMRQAYLTSPQHRLKASATTVLVSAIPKSWLTVQRLVELYDVFPGGIRNVWINRDFDDLDEKVTERDKLAKALEKAETELIVLCKKKHIKEMKLKAKADPAAAEQMKRNGDESEEMSYSPGLSSGDPHQIPTALSESAAKRKSGLMNLEKVPMVGSVVGNVDRMVHGVGKGVSDVGRGLGRGVMGGFGLVTEGVKKVTHNIERHKSTNEAHDVDLDTPASPERPDNLKHVDSWNTAKNARRGSTLAALEPQDTSSKTNTTNEDGFVLERSPDTLESTSQAVSHQPEESGLKTGFWHRKPKQADDDDERHLTNASPTSPRHVNTFADNVTGAVAGVVNGAVDFVFKPKARDEYPVAFDSQYEDDKGEDEPVWKRYITQKDRPTMRLPPAGWMPALPFLGKKVDTIYYCRKEVARLNLEIETDQETPENYPQMNSAFVQFNQQVAAHMACQAVSHHVPQHMCPRHIEVSPNDVIWGNMKMQWWERYIRSGLIFLATGGLVIGWAFPVAAVGLISQVKYLTETFHWLEWLNRLPPSVLGLISGVLPPLLLGILMALLPMILRVFARIQGCHTGMAIEKAVQAMYFAFLFIQVFLVVSISSGITTVIEKISNQPFAAPEILAKNLPKASNFFFSYLLLQAFSVSGAAILQIGTLVVNFILSPIMDTTARDKFKRATTLLEINWGTFFPVYTNLACIGIVYSVISPLILLFNIITFSLFWIVYRYNLLFVVNFRFDTGGLLFPRAINQLFTGIYVMEVCLIGLFFLVRDAQGEVACVPHAIIMIVALILTLVFHMMLNQAFGPLLIYLPITLEDDAVIRDEEFAKEQDEQRKKNLLGTEEVAGEDLNAALEDREKRELDSPVPVEGKGIEMSKLTTPTRRETTDMEEAGGHRIAALDNKPAVELFQHIADEIEDLTPEERDRLVARAFQHPAIRSKRPAIWIPRDDLGVSDDEVMRTMRFSEKIWVSNEFAGLDRKGRVVYRRSPPDLDVRDLVEL